MLGRRGALLVAAPALGLGLVVLPAGGAFAATTHLTATATGANEVGGTGLPGASAKATFTADPSTGRFCYTVTATGLSDAVGMHVHEAPAGVNGPITIPLDEKKINAGQACTTVEKAELADLVASPSDYYVNIHTPAHQAGAVRGQLSVATGGSPTSVAAGNGGQAAGSGLPLTGLALALGGGVVAAAGARRLAGTRR